MPKQEKVTRVAELKGRIEGSGALLLTEYRGLTVSEITELRRSLAQGGASFVVVKNTLMQRAVTDAGIPELASLLSGPSAVTFVQGDPVAAAKSVVGAQKLYPSLVLKGAYLDGRVLSAEEATSLADLESRDVMLSKIAGLMKGEMTRAAALFQGAQSKFLSLLEAYKAKLPGEEPEAAPEAAPEPGVEPEGAPEAAGEPAMAGASEEAAEVVEPTAEPETQPETQPETEGKE